ncbi:MAG: replicative DNA helicase [Syntrophales bacterium]|nr:replicative DNA helicase [Syntrophales bacterium]
MTEIDPSSHRIPPQNLDAERSVLGAVMIENTSLGTVMDIIEATDFYSDAHRKIFSAIVIITDGGEPADLITLSNALHDQGRLDKVGGKAYLAELVDNVASAANVGYYAKIIKEKAVKRAIIGTATKMLDAAYSPEKSAEEATAEAQQIILSLSMARGKRRIQTARDIVKTTFAMIEDRSKRGDGDAPTGISTGLSKLDELTLGLHGGELFVIAARPGVGKTALAICIARHVAQTGTPVFFYSAEMPAPTLMLRMLSGATGIDSHQLRRGSIFGESWASLARAAESIGSIPLYFDDGADMTPAELRAAARRAKVEHGIGLLIVDYMQLMRANGRYETREREVAEISRTLKGIAKELNIPVVGLSQLNRKIEDRTIKRPQLSDLRESGAIEQDADVIAFIYRDEVYNRSDDNPEKGIVEIDIAKHRNGPPGKVKVKFDSTTQTFRDMDDDR